MSFDDDMRHGATEQSAIDVHQLRVYSPSNTQHPAREAGPFAVCPETDMCLRHCGRRREWFGGIHHEHDQSGEIPVATAGYLHRRTGRMAKH